MDRGRSSLPVSPMPEALEGIEMSQVQQEAGICCQELML